MTMILKTVALTLTLTSTLVLCSQSMQGGGRQAVQCLLVLWLQVRSGHLVLAGHQGTGVQVMQEAGVQGHARCKWGCGKRVKKL